MPSSCLSLDRQCAATERVGDVPDEVHAAVATLMRGARVPGLSLAVVDREQLRFAVGFGAADLRAGAAAGPFTSYLWFSMSKLVTATAALRLADEGQLDLDAPAAEYVDHLHGPVAGHPTVRELLNHTAGLANPLPIRWVHPADADAPAAEDLLRRQVSHRRVYRQRPGGAARYSNVGYLGVGEVIAAAAGESYQEYVRRAVLEPAGMTRTGFSYRPGADAATGYVRVPRAADPVLRRVLPGGVVGARHGSYLSLNPFYVDGPAYGGLVGDVVDAGRFLRLHLGDGELDGRRVLSPATTRAMREVNRPGKPFDHGIGWFRRQTTGAGNWVEHFGAGAGFWNVMRLYPARGLGIVVMTNSTSSYDFEPLFTLLADASSR